MSGARGASAHEAASDAVGPLVRWLALRPDPADLHLLCPGSRALPGAGARDAVVVRLDVCAGDLPLSALLELALAGGRAVTVHAHDAPAPHDAPPGSPGGREARDAPPDDQPCADRAAADAVDRSTADAAALLRAAGRAERVTAAAADDAAARRRPWRARRRPAVLGSGDLALPRRAVLLPVVGARRPGGRGRAATERTRLLDALDVLGPGARGAALAGAGGAGAGAPGDSAPAAAPVTDPGAPAPGDAASAAPAPPADPRVPTAPGAAPAAAVLTATGCDACRVCVRACPTGALAITPRGGLLRLEQRVPACTDCGRCVELCPAHALTRTGRAPWHEVLDGTVATLATVVVATCRRCRGTYAPDAGSAGPGSPAAGTDPGLCPVCRFRRDHPFGSSAPGGGTTRA